MFASVAYAAGAPAGGAGAGGMETMLVQFMPLILMFVVFYFLLIRPQQKKAKEHKAMLGALKRGDNVITSSGILGRITDIENEIITLDLGKTEIKIVRAYVSGTVDLKNLTAAVEKSAAEKPQG